MSKICKALKQTISILEYKNTVQFEQFQRGKYFCRNVDALKVHPATESEKKII